MRLKQDFSEYFPQDILCHVYKSQSNISRFKISVSFAQESLFIRFDMRAMAAEGHSRYL